MVMLNFINSRQTSSAHIDDPSCNDSTFTCKKKKKKNAKQLLLRKEKQNTYTKKPS